MPYYCCFGLRPLFFLSGKKIGSLTTKIKQLGEFEAKEIEGAKIEDLLTKFAEKKNAQIEEWKSKGKEGNDKKLTDLIAELDKEKLSKSELKKALEEKETYIQTKESEFGNTFKTYKINDKVGKIKSSLPFIDDFSKKEVLKTGFEALVNSKYKFDLNDKDEVEVFMADGSHIKNPKKAGEFLKPEEVLLMEAEAQGLIKKNNATNEKKIIFVADDTNGQQKKSLVHPDARKNATRNTN